MGWMDKAKKLAEQAQDKLDEVQQNFNQGGSTPGQGDGARYDDHGRPVQDAPPAATTPPPSAEPTPAPSAAEPDPAATEPTASEPPASGDSPNSTPDPFKPLNQ
jgi:hypothetical protein